MAKCAGCGHYHYKGVVCPHCGGQMGKVERRYKPLNFQAEYEASKVGRGRTGTHPRGAEE